jgi:hypothetical protein
VLVSAISHPIGYVVISNISGKTGAFVQAFAAGALLTITADKTAPEAYSRAVLAKGITTAFGFVHCLTVLYTPMIILFGSCSKRMQSILFSHRELHVGKSNTDATFSTFNISN